MHVQVLQDNLKAALTAIMPTIAGKSTLPVLDTIRFSADGKFTLTATNLETTITIAVGARIEKPGEVCIPAKVLNDLVSSLPSDRIDMELDRRSMTLRILCAGYKASIQCIDGEEFPMVPVIKTSFDIPMALVRSAASNVAFAAATDISRGVLNGVHMVLNGVARIESADGYRSARLEQELEGSIDPVVDVVVPAKALQIAAKAFKGLEETVVRVGITSTDSVFAPNQLLFDAGPVQVMTRLLDGKFPEIDRILPTTFAARVVVETRELKQLLTVANVYASQSSGTIKISVTPPDGDMGYGKLAISAKAAEIGEGTAVIDASVVGQPVETLLNIGYLNQALGCIETLQVAIEIQNGMRPALFKPVGTDGYVHVVMPMVVTK